MRAKLERPTELTIRARARSGQPVRLHVAGLLGRILQHQLDHLDGEFLLDRMRGADRNVARRRASEPARCTLPAAC